MWKELHSYENALKAFQLNTQRKESAAAKTAQARIKTTITTGAQKRKE